MIGGENKIVTLKWWKNLEHRVIRKRLLPVMPGLLNAQNSRANSHGKSRKQWLIFFSECCTDLLSNYSSCFKSVIQNLVVRSEWKQVSQWSD